MKSSDQANIGVDTNNDNVTTRILVNPYHKNSMIGYEWGLFAYSLNDNGVDPVILGASENLADLVLDSTGNSILYSKNIVPDSYVDTFWEVLYMKPDYEGASSGVVQLSRDIFDKYFTRFEIKYNAWNDQTQSYEEKMEWFDSPNDLTKELLGFDMSQPMPWVPNLTIDPQSNEQGFVDYFARLNDIFTNPDRAADLGRLICRTARGVPQHNDVYQKLAVLQALSEDPLTQDEMYPTFIKLIEDKYPP